jgi:dinuclear metal center YbgI/SA1388 family protein
MLITDFTRALEEIIPLGAIGFEKDAVGMQVGLPGGAELTKALFAYEVTSEVIEEARSVGANLIVAYHPLIFPSMRSIGDSDRTGALVRELVKHDIGLYIQHTAFDAHPKHGTSRLMAEALGLENIQPLAPLKGTLNKIVVYVPVEQAQKVAEAMSAAGAGRIGDYIDCSFRIEGSGTFLKRGEKGSQFIGEPGILERVDEVRLEMISDRWNTGKAVSAMIKAHPYEEPAYDVIPLINESPNFGMGAAGEWPTALDLEEMLSRARNAFGSKALRHNRVTRTSFKRAAMVGGAGMDFYSAAQARADVFITADVRYHDFYRAEHSNILLIDAGHAETERFVAQGMVRVARDALGSSTLNLSDETAQELVLVARTEPNAVRYFV